jgi:hypothetical protein
MTTNGQVTDRFAQAAPDGAMLRPRSNTVFVSADGHTIYSYGHHFPMATIMPAADGTARGWWLVNGDRHSVTTSGHQSALRTALARTGLPVLIVPFSALESAGIRHDSITPVAIDPDQWETVWHSEAKPEGTYAYDYRTLPNGQQQWSSYVHHLGASVFTANYGTRTYGMLDAGRGDVLTTATFLSAFDEQEGHGLYFLAELPAGAHPATVAEALTALRPNDVLAADQAGVHVTRQGDVFAVPAEITTRELPGPSRHGAYVLGVNHTATEVRELDGVTYARGTLRHRPRESWRSPEHKMQRMGNGRQWHRLVKNTVPEGRSWSVSGNVD